MTEWLMADSLWWDGRLRVGEALRLGDGAAHPANLPSGATPRRMPGTLLPGLRDAHVHSALVDLTLVRSGGIAAVWDLGGVPDQVAALAARAGSALPRIRFAGPFLIQPGGYPSDRSWAPAGSWREVRSAADAVEAVDELQTIGATLVKVTANASGPLLPAPTFRALVDAAHAAGLPVVVHAEGPGTVAAAHEAGADILAHTPWTETVDIGLTRACAGHMTWLSTLDIHGWGTPTPEQGTAIANLRRFHEYGGTVRYGTDLGNGPLPPGVNPREIRALQSAGLSPTEILTTMTQTPHKPSPPKPSPPAPSPPAPSPIQPCWIPGGLDLDPASFADTVATARVVDPSHHQG